MPKGSIDLSDSMSFGLAVFDGEDSAAEIERAVHLMFTLRQYVSTDHIGRVKIAAALRVLASTLEDSRLLLPLDTAEPR